MLSAKISKYDISTGQLVELNNINVKNSESRVAGTLKLYCEQNIADVTDGEFVTVQYGEYEYYMQVLMSSEHECVLVDLLSYNMAMYQNVTTFQELVAELKKLIIFPEKCTLYEFVNFSVRPGRLIDLLIQCQSNGIILSALDGTLRILEVDSDVKPAPTVEVICNTWSIC